MTGFVELSLQLSNRIIIDLLKFYEITNQFTYRTIEPTLTS